MQYWRVRIEAQIGTRVTLGSCAILAGLRPMIVDVPATKAYVAVFRAVRHWQRTVGKGNRRGLLIECQRLRGTSIHDLPHVPIVELDRDGRVVGGRQP
jgi:hypothetical protein